MYRQFNQQKNPKENPRRGDKQILKTQFTADVKGGGNHYA